VEQVGSLVQIIIINIVLSGDNAVVIGMAAHPLAPRQRRLAIIGGGGAAIVLRIVLTTGAAMLLTLPAVKAIGGVLLLWIAFQLLEEPDEQRAGARPSHSLRAAIMTILVADLIMSLDNVLGVAAASNGSLGLLVFGLLISMLIVMIGGGVFASLIDRLWWLTYLGAAVIAWTGVDMALSDEFIQVQLQPLVVGVPEIGRLLFMALVTIAVVAAAHVVHRRPPARAVGSPRRSVY
jgi:YjbE family integral membrane protein